MMSFRRSALVALVVGMTIGTSSMKAAAAPLQDRRSSARAAGGRVDYFFAGKRRGKPERCEDGILFSDRYLVVVDGATDKSGRRYGGRTSGRVVRDLVIEVFGALEADVAPAQVVKRLNARIQRFYSQHQEIDFLREPVNRATASLVWYSFARKELVALGDCKARVDGRRFNHRGKGIDALISETRRRAFLQLSKTIPREERSLLARRFIDPLLADMFRYQNNPKAPRGLRYWVLDGFPVTAEGLAVLRLARPPHRIELSSDGYPDFPPQRTIAAYERLLARSLARDPYRVGRYPSTKGLQKGQVSYDDRAVLIWRR